MRFYNILNKTFYFIGCVILSIRLFTEEISYLQFLFDMLILLMLSIILSALITFVDYYSKNFNK